jgi:hypothetical protein
VYTAPRVYNNYYYSYPRRYFSFSYGWPGLGYYYYDTYPDYAYPYARRYDGRVFTWYGSFGGYGLGYATGELRLEVRPKHAEVYVDGYYAGTVDDFDGFTQGLRLEEGPYTIELRAPGFEAVVFDVRIQAGRRISYRADLRPVF